MEAKINELEALLKRTIELCKELKAEAEISEVEAKAEYRALRDKDEAEEERAYDKYCHFHDIVNGAWRLSIEAENALKHNDLFK